MIVIIILAILTGIAVPSYMVLRTRARVVAAKAEMKNLSTALAMYNADYELYPATLAELVTPLAAAPGETVVIKYIAKIPATDPWGVATGTAPGYVYVCASPLGTYTLTCSEVTPSLVITDGDTSW
jgi:type II secretory pathway pseudopilin PulG